MNIILVRRISQVFFLVLFLWFCVVATLGESWWQLRGWPVNWFLELDPLVGIGTLWTTRTLYKGLAWCLGTIVLTIVLGRFFCGWVCPFGTLHQFVGFIGRRNQKPAVKIRLNAFRKAQHLKYGILIFMLLPASLQTGLLDPMPLFHRSVNLVLLAVADRATFLLSAGNRYYENAWTIATLFLCAVFLNLLIPRFYCRFICPLGALLGIFSRYSIWRIGQKPGKCVNCKICEMDCEGACEPSARIRISECVLCMNCLHCCPDDLIGFAATPSASGEIPTPDLERRELIVAAISGMALAPILRLGGGLGPNWNPALIRPPGSIDEPDFLSRCIRCGQCMRICPTNIVHPAGFAGGLEGVWTPTLNFRIGTSGCQLNCIACGNICPTAAIRPISLEEKLGKKNHMEKGPIRIGTAFVDRNRCLPWAMDKPCIVCQENCPVSPKAIFTRQFLGKVRLDSAITVKSVAADRIAIQGGELKPGQYATGDYGIQIGASGDRSYHPIVENSSDVITISEELKGNPSVLPGTVVGIHVRLQRPFVDPQRCIGCGTCEHECPVSGKRAIRISAENESRNKNHALLL